MKGHLVRPKLPNPTLVRIVVDVNDSTRDIFVSQGHANHLWQQRKIVKFNCGREYPDTYRRIEQ